ncbi:MAG: efflux RND transporter permease subunit, partial [Desulfovibrionaceae bacterium]|nr:efflux RND transporter permease subunit [Desulfovibrionaceae bacterium]
MSISRFFIDRPVFASVLAILLMLAGGVSCLRLPIAQFPQLAPPTISMVIEYSGASAQTMQDNVAQIVEQRMTGLDRLLYITSNSSSEGRCRLALTFEPGTDGNIALMQVQNCLDLAMPNLPDTVKSQGIRVRKVSDSFMRFYSIYDANGVIPVEDIADFASSTLVDPISRLDGVGDTTLFGSPYAMRIWLDPNKLRSFSLTPADVVSAVENQNSQISVGQLGGLPAVSGQEINVTLLSRVKLQTVEQFRNVVVRVNPDGSAVRISDVARVEMGRQGYAIGSRFNGNPSATIGIQLAEGANAVTTAQHVDEFMQRMQQFFPEGVTYAIAGDTIPFVQASIKSVVHTLIEAVILVALIMFLFLQNWRATLIPTMAVPIVLLGTMAVVGATGGSINTLSMFGLVLAIGLLVDDAIVVVENTERIMHTEGLSAPEAIRKSMDQITWALIGVAAVLSAVFIPMSFFGGIPGAIYREFSVTIVSAMTLSVFVAIVVTPPMCAGLLKQNSQPHSGFFAAMNRGVDAATRAYGRAVRALINNTGKVMAVYVCLAGLAVWALEEMPRSFLPVEDQGSVYVNVFMQPGSTSEATTAVVREIEDYFKNDEGDLVESMGMMLGMGPYGSRGQNVATGYINLKHWDERPHADQSTGAVVRRARAHFAGNPQARILFSEPPQVRGLGSASGIVMQLEDQGGLGYDALVQARTDLLEMAARTVVGRFFVPMI